MQSLFQTQIQTIGQMLSGSNTFRMPPFQRPYSWDEGRALQLFDDLYAVVERESYYPELKDASGHYFLGPIVVAQARASDPHEVVDGQQRLVTLTAMLAVLRDALPAGRSQSDLQSHFERPEHALLGHSHSPRIVLHTPYRTEFEQFTLRLGSTRHLPPDAKTDGMDRLLNVIRRLSKEAAEHPIATVEKLIAVILRQTFVVVMTATTLDDAYLLFRSVNTPGQPLSSLDLVKVELMGKLNPSDEQTHALSLAWMRAQEELGDDRLEEYVNTILRLVMPNYDGRDLKVGLKEVLADSRRLVAFRSRLEGFIQNYSAFDSATLDFGPSSASINRIVACFQGLPFDDWRPTALLWLSSGPTSSIYANSPSAKKSEDFFRALNALCLGFVILGVPKSKRVKRFQRINEHIAQNRDVFALNSELFLTSAERDQINKLLQGPIGEKAEKVSYLKALLLRMNAEMSSDIPPFFPPNITLEHVLPQNPARNSKWVKDFPNIKRRRELCYMLGNLTILTHPANSTIGNADFTSKKRSIFGTDGNQSFALNSSLMTNSEWNETAILSRQRDLLHLADRVLRI
ncbi:DUF262 domain-containing protein [Hyphomicrobium facile]|nr:DUF262 domain-containing protein [Hyphomicrobium facile]